MRNLKLGDWSTVTTAQEESWSLLALPGAGFVTCGTATASAIYVGKSTGYIYKSTDGGTTWTELTNAGSHRWVCACHVGDVVYFGASDPGYIYKSTDGGTTWNPVVSADISYWNTCCADTTGNLFFGTYADIYSSRDGGTTWNRTGWSMRNWVSCVAKGTSVYFGYTAVYGQGQIARTTDGGRTWNMIYTVTSSESFGAACVDPAGRIFFSGGGAGPGSTEGRIYYSPSGSGNDFVEIASAPYGNWAAAVADETGVYFASYWHTSIPPDTFKVCHSSDGGETWELITGAPALRWKAGFQSSTASFLGGDSSLWKHSLYIPGDIVSCVHDIILESGSAIMESNLAQRIDCTLRTFLGEHWLNPAEGMPYFQEFLKKNPDISVCKQAFATSIQSVPGVSSLDRLDVNFSNSSRAFRVDFDATGTDTVPVSSTSEVAV